MHVPSLTSGGLLALVITAFLQGCKEESTVASDVQVADRQCWLVKDEGEATSLAIAVLDLSATPPLQTAAEMIVLHEDNTPFLSDQLIDRPLWRITLHGYKLRLASAVPGFGDRYERVFDVLVDPVNGNVLKAASRWPDGVPMLPPEPPAWYAEEQMDQAGSAKYDGFPEEPPSITLLRALDVVLSDGVGSPLMAKQIAASYVLHSRMGREPTPVWAITLRGIPPLPIHGIPPTFQGDARQIAAERGPCIIHNFVDARTGKWLGANTAPQPFWAHDETIAPGIPITVPPPPDPTVTFDLASPQDGLSVSRGGIVEWTITATVSTDDNEGLAMAAVDLLQDPSNPELVEVAPGNRPEDMEDFDRPNGVSNPTVGQYYNSAYGGTPVGTPGASVLLQIGGGQNIFGAVGDGIGLDLAVDAGVGQSPGGQVIATGALLAPCTDGVYTFSIDAGVANVLEQINPAPQLSLVRSGEILYSEVHGGCGNCDTDHGGLGCSDEVCEMVVCSLDPFCCSVAWDQLCADRAIEHCDCETANSPMSFNVAGSAICPLDTVGPSNGPPDGKIAVNDFLELLGTWSLVGAPADFIDPPGVGKEDLLLLLYYWGVCPCMPGTEPASLQEEFVDAGMAWPDDWDTFMECVHYGTPDEQESCACWLKEHLEDGGAGDDEITFQGFAAPVPTCPGEDPFGEPGGGPPPIGTGP